MTNYHLNSPTLPSFATQEAKAARQKQLEAVRKRRALMEQERRKRQERAYQTNTEYREYQDMLKAQVGS